MKVKKTIKAKIVFLTKVKQRLLEEDYNNLQPFLRGEKAELYSANKQQAIWKALGQDDYYKKRVRQEKKRYRHLKKKLDKQKVFTGLSKQ